MVWFLIGAAVGLAAGYEAARAGQRYEDTDTEPVVYRPVPMEHTHGGDE